MGMKRESQEFATEICPYCAGTGKRPTAAGLTKSIREFRKERGLSLRQAALELKISAAHLSDIENQKRRPSAKVLKRIAALQEG